MSPRAVWVLVWSAIESALIAGSIASGQTWGGKSVACALLAVGAVIAPFSCAFFTAATGFVEDSQNNWRQRRAERLSKRPDWWVLAERDATKGTDHMIWTWVNGSRQYAVNPRYVELCEWVQDQRKLIEQDQRVWDRVVFLLDGGDVFSE